MNGRKRILGFGLAVLLAFFLIHGGAVGDEPIDVNQLSVREDRNEYDSDEAYANFRPVTVGNMAENTLYRSSSPIGWEIEERTRTADELASKAGIRTILNMASTEEETRETLTGPNCVSPYCKQLYEEGRIWSDRLPYNVSDKAFTDGLAGGLAFLAENDPPYLIHCHGGKDRTGFAVMILSMLMGAADEEMVQDYMVTLTNYYGIEPGTDAYQNIADNYIRKMINNINQQFCDSPENPDNSRTAQAYLLSIGLPRETIDILTQKLSGL